MPVSDLGGIASGGDTVSVWSIGSWTSQTNDVSLHRETTNEWKRLSWLEENTEDSSMAYVEVDLLNSGGTVLKSNASVVSKEGRKEINIGNLGTSISQIDLKFKFRLFSLTKSPIISDIQLT